MHVLLCGCRTADLDVHSTKLPGKRGPLRFTGKDFDCRLEALGELRRSRQELAEAQRIARLGSFELGVGLSFVFFAAIAAGADVVAMIEVAPMLTVLVFILLSVHVAVTFGLGLALKLSLPELITASNAAILGATTAPALAATRGWKNLVTPGVLVGVLGYALGTFLGTVIFKYWGALL